LFLESQGKLDDFKKWSIAERDRQQAEWETKQAEQKAQKDQEAAERREAAAAAAEARRQQELAAQQMQYAIGQQEQSYAPAPQQQSVTYSDGWWGDGNYGYGAAYYYNNAYRGAVRDRAQNAYQRWQQNRPANLPARGGGGGVRRGGGRR
jgi:hypothetical protein